MADQPQLEPPDEPLVDEPLDDEPPEAEPLGEPPLEDTFVAVAVITDPEGATSHHLAPNELLP